MQFLAISDRPSVIVWLPHTPDGWVAVEHLVNPKIYSADNSEMLYADIAQEWGFHDYMRMTYLVIKEGILPNTTKLIEHEIYQCKMYWLYFTTELKVLHTQATFHFQ